MPVRGSDLSNGRGHLNHYLIHGFRFTAYGLGVPGGPTTPDLELYLTQYAEFYLTPKPQTPSLSQKTTFQATTRKFPWAFHLKKLGCRFKGGSNPTTQNCRGFGIKILVSNFGPTAGSQMMGPSWDTYDKGSGTPFKF